MNRARTPSRHLQIAGAFVFVAVPVAVAVACGGKIEGQNGNPSPSATTTATTTPTPTSSATSAPRLSCDGQPFGNPPPCAVSFQQAIFPYLTANGEWACGNANCHGAVPSGNAANEPTIDVSDASGAYGSLTAFSFDGMPYVNVCSTDPNASSILCNLTGACAPAMPVAGDGVTPTIPPADDTIEI